jgi:hypothetical protein
MSGLTESDFAALEDALQDRGKDTRTEDKLECRPKVYKTLLPEAVMHAEHLSVAYGNAAMVSAVELAKEVVEMKSVIEILKAELAETNRKLNELIGK